MSYIFFSSEKDKKQNCEEPSPKMMSLSNLPRRYDRQSQTSFLFPVPAANTWWRFTITASYAASALSCNIFEYLGLKLEGTIGETPTYAFEYSINKNDSFSCVCRNTNSKQVHIPGAQSNGNPRIH